MKSAQSCSRSLRDDFWSNGHSCTFFFFSRFRPGFVIIGGWILGLLYISLVSCPSFLYKDGALPAHITFWFITALCRLLLSLLVVYNGTPPSEHPVPAWLGLALLLLLVKFSKNTPVRQIFGRNLLRFLTVLYWCCNPSQHVSRELSFIRLAH